MNRSIHCTNSISLDGCSVEGIDQSDDLSVGGDEDEFAIRAELEARPITVLVLLHLEGGEWTLVVVVG